MTDIRLHQCRSPRGLVSHHLELAKSKLLCTTDLLEIQILVQEVLCWQALLEIASTDFPTSESYATVTSGNVNS